MSEDSVQDAGGDTITLVRYNGVLFPKFDLRVLEEMSSIELRETDIMVYTYPKSGSHWTVELCSLLLDGNMDSTTVPQSRSVMLEMAPKEEYQNNPSPRIFFTHAPWDLLPTDIFKKKVKVIHVIRNPKDVAVSYYNFCKRLPLFYGYDGAWENFLFSQMGGKLAYGSWFDFVRKFEEVTHQHPDHPFLTLHYEDMNENLRLQTERLSRFLGLHRSPEFLQSVSDRCTFTNMKVRKEQEKGPANDILYRRGEVGDWKNWFTESQNEWFDKLYQDNMKNCRVKVRYILEDA